MTMNSRFSNNDVAAIAPVSVAFNVTPSDETEFSVPTRMIILGVSGDLRVTMAGYHDEAGATLTLPKQPSGVPLPYRVVKIHATGTTASDIVRFH